MKRAILPLLALFVLSGCGHPAPDHVVSVTALADNIVAWDGEQVTVEGWLGKCSNQDCHIFATVSDMNIVSRSNYESDEWSEAFRRGISIGYDDEFDKRAEPLQYTFVRVRARVNKECWPANCLDRADVLQPISITSAGIERREN